MILRYRAALLHEAGGEGNLLLHLAAFQGRSEWIDRLEADGAYFNAKNKAGGTALHLAAYAGKPQAVESLLKRGADKDALNHYRESALHVATWLNHERVVQALLAAGASPYLRAAKGETLLHYAARRCSPALIRLYAPLFAKRREKLDPRDASGATPLMLTLQEKAVACERALVEAGARARSSN
jgi:ankyrin repeat protein